MGWMLLWRAVTAAKKLHDDPAAGAAPENKKNAFYHGQIKSAEYYILNVLPVIQGKIRAVMEGGSAMIEISDKAFGAF